MPSSVAVPVVSDDYAWADVVIDLHTDRGTRLPGTLPEMLPPPFEPAHQTTGRMFLLGSNSLLSFISDRVLFARSGEGRSAALVMPQPLDEDDSDTLDRVSRLFGAGVAMTLTRGRSSDRVQRLLERLIEVGTLLTSPAWRDRTTGWNDVDSHKWLPLLLAGADTYDQLQKLEQAGFPEPTDPARKSCLTEFADAVNAGLSADEVAEWWPAMESFDGVPWVKVALSHGLRYADVAPWQTTSLHVGGAALGQEYLNERFTAIKEAVDGGWTPADFQAVEATAVPGCSPLAWMRIWTMFMSPELAAMYVRAGYPLQEAVRRHLTDDDVPEDMLRFLGSLQHDTEHPHR